MRSALTPLEGMSSTAPIRPAAPPHPEQFPLIEEALRMLESPVPDWAGLANLITRLPARLLRLLPTLGDVSRAAVARPLRDALEARVATRLETLGPRLMRAWLLTDPAPDTAAANAASVFRGECARHLAMECRYPFPDEAFLAGLYDGSDNDPSWAGWLEAAPFSPALRDALAFPDIDDEGLLTAHPLIRLTGIARRLVRHDWQEQATRLERLSGLSSATLACLRTDTAYLASFSGSDADTAPRQTRVERTETNESARHALLRNAALEGLLRSAFDLTDVDLIDARLRHGIDLFAPQARTRVIALYEEDGRLRPLPLGVDRDGEALIDELALRLDDPLSVVALSARSGQPTAWGLEGATRSRSLADQHIGRLFGTAGFDCLPMPDAQATAIFARGRVRRELDAISPLERLCAAASAAIRREQQRRRATAELEASINARYLDRARTLSHEAKNPLSVIRSYLDVMAQRHPSINGLGDEVSVINSEIDRLADLIRKSGEPLAAEAEAARCQVGDVLADLRRLYARPLFEDRGIQFEVRIASGLPAVAMAASQLKQVLINLFRNASEALLPGGRLSVVIPGQLISNGVTCVEIRIIDNGPGLPRERLAQLFSPAPSSKGGEHLGLGLHIVMDILQKSGAYILCRSQPGIGTSFQLLVPVPESG